MPRSTRKASETPSRVWTVSPWKKAKRGTQRSSPNAPSFEKPVSEPSSDIHWIHMNPVKAALLRKSLERWIQNCASEWTDTENNGFLVFEESGGAFIGLAMDSDKRLSLYFNGIREIDVFPDCSHDAHVRYRVEWEKEGNAESVEVINRGGDHARLSTLEEALMNQFSFECKTLLGNSTDTSPIADYFSNVDQSEKIVLNIGVLKIEKDSDL